jgi:hypothetical protein
MPLTFTAMSRLVLMSGLLLGGTPTFAQGTHVQFDRLTGGSATEAWSSGRSAEERQRTLSVGSRTQKLEQAARDLTFRYLEVWSTPKRVTLASVAPFYDATVAFHGKRRPLTSVVAEKRRFAKRWPRRDYRHRPEATQVTCEDGVPRCTVRASFDFNASNDGQSRRSEGLGEHELVLSFSSGRPIIVSEDSRVIIRGRGNMTNLLPDGR